MEEKKMLDGYEVVIRTVDEELARKIKQHIEWKFDMGCVDIKRSYLTDIDNDNNKLKMIKEDVEVTDVLR